MSRSGKSRAWIVDVAVSGLSAAAIVGLALLKIGRSGPRRQKASPATPPPPADDATWETSQIASVSGRPRGWTVDAALSLVVIAAIFWLALYNFGRARALGTPARLRICAVAARDLPPGALLSAADLALRIRRQPAGTYWSDTTPLVGRQLAIALRKGDVVASTALVELQDTRPVSFWIDMDEGVVSPGQTIALVRGDAPTKAVSLPTFCVLAVEPLAAGDEDKRPRSRVRLQAKRAVDASRVLAEGAAKLVPLVVGQPAQ